MTHQLHQSLNRPHCRGIVPTILMVPKPYHQNRLTPPWLRDPHYRPAFKTNHNKPMLFQPYQSYQHITTPRRAYRNSQPTWKQRLKTILSTCAGNGRFYVCLFVWLKNLCKKTGPRGLTPGLFFNWQEWRGSNPQPPVLETGALPIELHSMVRFCVPLVYFTTDDTTPAPTVRPPSRIAKRKPSSIAIGAIKVTVIAILSPGITISVPAGNSTEPVTSVVRK